jgi:Squalene/phytoene synthase
MDDMTAFKVRALCVVCLCARPGGEEPSPRPTHDLLPSLFLFPFSRVQGKEHVKIHHLNTFYSTGLVTEGWSMSGVGEGDERVLLEQYHRCVSVYKRLSTASQVVIADITRRMGEGMASYVGKDLGQGTVTVDDYNLYCHYVAGLVGEGLSRLFTCSGYESPAVAGVSSTLANTMGLFLQVSASPCVSDPRPHLLTCLLTAPGRKQTSFGTTWKTTWTGGRSGRSRFGRSTRRRGTSASSRRYTASEPSSRSKTSPPPSSITCDDINCSRSRGPARWRA